MGEMRTMEQLLDEYTDRILAGIEHWKVVPRDEMLFYLGEFMTDIIEVASTPYGKEKK